MPAARERFATLAQHDDASLMRLRSAAGPDAQLWTIPSLAGEASDLEALQRLGHHLPGLGDGES